MELDTLLPAPRKCYKLELSVISYGYKSPIFRWTIAFLLIIAVVLLGAAAKRSQFPSANAAPSYLCNAVKMVEVRFHQTETAILVPSPSPQCIASIPVPSSAIPPRICIGEKPLRIELQSPPLLV